jgi:AraC-like DNA-binding protein
MAIDRFRHSKFHNYSLEKKAIPMGQVAGIVQMLNDRGYSPAASLVGTGIDLDQLGNVEQRVSYRQRITQLENMVALPGMDGVWLETPRDVSISDYGLLGYAMMSSATLAQAVQIAVKYHKMAGTLFELTFVVDGDDAVLRIEHLLAGGPAARYVVEDLFLGIAPLISLLIGEDHRPNRILLNYPAPAHAEKYQRCFRCGVEFEKPWCEYRFDRTLLDRQLAEADSNTARICEESCRALLNQMEIEEDIISRVCHLLLSTPGEFPKLDAVAQKLSLGARTLRRRLSELGTSYQRILDDVRRQLAIEYLQTTNLTVQEIAELLGYSEVTNFRRAFMRWVELSPYQYRKQLTI